MDANCETSWEEIRDVDRNTLFGVEYIVDGKVKDQRRVCHVTNPNEFVDQAEPVLKQLDVEITYCGEGCCIYETL